MRLRSALGSAFALTFVCLNAAHASGFALSELSISGLSEADALVANTTTLGALAYNPAAMAFHKGGYDLGLLGIDDHTEVTPTGGQTVVATTPTWETVPDLFWADKVAPHTRFGFGVNTPYGMQISWPAQTFPELAQGADAALAPTYTELRLFDVSPSLSYRFGAVAIDLGADYYDAHRTIIGTPTTTVSGSGDQVGMHFGVLAKLGSIGLGANYRSASNVPLDGTLSTTGSAPVPINATLHLPWQLALGVHDALSKKIGVEFDFDRTGWSRFTNIAVTPAPAAGGGPSLVTSTYDWQSANAYRVGFHYALSRHVRLRAGYAYDQTGAGNSDYSARIPDANRQIFSFGASQKLGHWSLSAGYMYVHFNTRTYASTTALTTSDPNGTSAYNGTYKSHAQLFGISISRRFS